jgi:hypothetical protein
VRGEVLGTVRGQEIKPSLAGFGDTVTNWFFKTGLNAGPARTAFSVKRQALVQEKEVWWVTCAARWKQSDGWSGPDALFTCAIDESGAMIRLVETKEVFKALQNVEPGKTTREALPDLSPSKAAALEALRSQLPKGIDARHLVLFPLTLILWQ